MLNIQITNASLPNIQGAIGAGIDDGGWISTAYLVAEIVVIPLTGFLTPVFSLRRYLLGNTIMFLVMSVACAFAQNLDQMIVLRALQGFFGGVLIPMAFTITLTMLPRSKQPIGLAMFAVSATFAPAIGPTIGGYLTENYGWQYIFYVNLVPGAIMLATLWPSLRPAPMKLAMLRDGDWPGIATLAIGLASLQTVLEEGNKDDWFGSPFIVRLSIVAAVSLALFFWIELTSRNPLLNLRLLLRRNFGLGSLANVILGMALYGSVYLLPVYLSQMQGYNSEQVGMVLAWTGLPQLVLIPFVPFLMRHIDTRLLVAVGFGAVRAELLHEPGDHAGLCRRPAVRAEPGARRGSGAGADAAVRAGDRWHRAGERRFGIGDVQHDAQPGRLRRHRGAGNVRDQAGAVPLQHHHRACFAAGRGDPGADRIVAGTFPGDRSKRSRHRLARRGGADRADRSRAIVSAGLQRRVLPDGSGFAAGAGNITGDAQDKRRRSRRALGEGPGMARSQAECESALGWSRARKASTTLPPCQSPLLQRRRDFHTLPKWPREGEGNGPAKWRA